MISWQQQQQQPPAAATGYPPSWSGYAPTSSYYSGYSYPSSDHTYSYPYPGSDYMYSTSPYPYPDSNRKQGRSKKRGRYVMNQGLTEEQIERKDKERRAEYNGVRHKWNKAEKDAVKAIAAAARTEEDQQTRDQSQSPATVAVDLGEEEPVHFCGMDASDVNANANAESSSSEDLLVPDASAGRDEAVSAPEGLNVAVDLGEDEELPVDFEEEEEHHDRNRVRFDEEGDRL